jgi:hypothetical protein
VGTAVDNPELCGRAVELFEVHRCCQDRDCAARPAGGGESGASLWSLSLRQACCYGVDLHLSLTFTALPLVPALLKCWPLIPGTGDTVEVLAAADKMAVQEWHFARKGADMHRFSGATALVVVSSIHPQNHPVLLL